MNRLHTAARAVLDRSPMSAMPLDAFIEALAREHPELRVDGRSAMERLARCEGIRVIRRPPSADAANWGPDAWLVAYPHGRSRPCHPCLLSRRLRSAVATLGRDFNIRSLAAWARWNALVLGTADIIAAVSHPRSPRRSDGRRWTDPRSPAIRSS